jgi:diguanylate cyclase (GGDEF)-like protein
VQYGRAVAGLFVVSVLISTIVSLWPGVVARPQWAWLIADFVVALVTAAFAYFRPKMARRLDPSYLALVLVTVAVLATGGQQSPLWPLYFLVVAGAAMFSTFRRVIFVGLITAILSLTPALFGPLSMRFIAQDFVLIALVAVIGYLSAFLSAEAREQRKIRGLLEDIFRASSFEQGDELASMLGGVVAVLARLTRADYVICYLISEDGQQLIPEASDISPGVPNDEAIVLSSWPVPIGQGVTGYVARSGEKLLTSNLEQDPRSVTIPGTPDNTTSAIFIPLRLDAQVVGVLRVSHRGANYFSEADLEMAEVFGRHATFAIQNARLYAETRHLYRKMRVLSITDGLTGLHNQRYLSEEAPRLLAEAKASGQPLSVLMIDSDCLKSVNDQFGHAFGDEFLRELAAVIRREVRSGDVVVRYAGDEFIALLVDATSEAARQVAERIRLAVQAMQIGIDVPLAVSIGIATLPDHADDLDRLLRAADQALYVSKGAGRNRSTVFSLAAN